MISVIIPVYNVEKYLSECIESVLSQSYKEFEIILVDDGSTDNSGKICDEYSLKYENIKVIHKKNEGLGFTRNAGIKAARGKYFVFIDSDDYIEKDCFKRLMALEKKGNYDYIKTAFRRVDDNKNILYTNNYVTQEFHNDSVRKKLIHLLVGSSPNKHDSLEMSVCAILYKASIIRKYNIKFQSERKLMSEDLIFNIDYLMNSNKAIVLDYISYNYRFNPFSLTSSYRTDRFECVLDYYKYLNTKLSDIMDNDLNLRIKKTLFICVKMCICQESKHVSKHSKNVSIEKINNIVNNFVVNDAINNYPIKKLGIKQQLFIFLIKSKMNRILYFLANMKILK